MARWKTWCCLSLFCAGGVGLTAPAAAQGAPANPEALIDASLAPETGLILARRQVLDADLLAAAATLERVLLAQPGAAAPRLLYASLLCRLDDRPGAQVEIDLMGGRPASDDAWAEVTKACGPITHPAGTQGGTR